MTNETILATISSVVAKLGMTAAQSGDVIEIRDSKKRLAAIVNADGTIARKYDGKQALMGAFGASQITAALNGAK